MFDPLQKPGPIVSRTRYGLKRSAVMVRAPRPGWGYRRSDTKQSRPDYAISKGIFVGERRSPNVVGEGTKSRRRCFVSLWIAYSSS